MTKKEFIELYAEKGNLTKKEAEKNINLFLESVEESLVKGDEVTFVGWGKWEVVERAAREVRSPQSKEIINKVEEYCDKKKLGHNDRMFTIKVRWVQKYIQKISFILGASDISTHSFRKTYAHIQYLDSQCNIELVRKLLNHSSVSVTQRYLGITDEEVNEASANFKIIF